MMYNRRYNAVILNGAEIDKTSMERAYELADNKHDCCHVATWSVRTDINCWHDDECNGTLTECLQYARGYAKGTLGDDSPIDVVLVSLYGDLTVDHDIALIKIR